jgi:hypothetical protein
MADSQLTTSHVDSTIEFPKVDGVEFRSIEGEPGYCYGTDGSVWSRKARGNLRGKLADTWRPMKPTYGKINGYPHVVLCNGKKCHRNVTVHRKILEAFVGPCPPGMVACHWDGNPKNCALSNLRWATYSDNGKDSVRHGTVFIAQGEDSVKALLTESQVREILSLRVELGIGSVPIARRLGISNVSAVHSVIHGKSWNHISGLPKYGKRNVPSG